MLAGAGGGEVQFEGWVCVKPGGGAAGKPGRGRVGCSQPARNVETSKEDVIPLVERLLELEIRRKVAGVVSMLCGR